VCVTSFTDDLIIIYLFHLGFFFYFGSYRLEGVHTLEPVKQKLKTKKNGTHSSSACAWLI